MEQIPNTYFEFSLGYAFLWLILFGAVLYALWQLRMLSTQVKSLVESQSTKEKSKSS